MATVFSLNWDYRCPFARIVHENVMAGVQAGADWEVDYTAFCLDQPHIAEGEPAVWEAPGKYPGVFANLVGIVVRDMMPARFLDVHRALFSARHDLALDLRERGVVADVLKSVDVSPAGVFRQVESGWPLMCLKAEHTEAVDRFSVFGVPTFVLGERAVFVRLMERPGDDGNKAMATVNRVLRWITEAPEVNEFKHTTLSI